MEAKEIDTVIIGGGQAGLATSYYLTRHGCPHVVLERSDRAAANWRHRTWDSFTLVTPNWAFKMPGVEDVNAERDGFMGRTSVIHFFENYITTFGLPVMFNTIASSIEPTTNERYLVKANGHHWHAKNVVVATGLFQHGRIPSFSNKLFPACRQLHSSEYRRPEALPEGAVLVVGSGQSGCQIAEELFRAGRKVFLSTGRAGRAPRRYRGKDVIEWLEIIGFFNLTVDQLPPGMGKFDGIPHLSGADGGHTINLHQFARDGITLLGHVRDAMENTIVIDPDLYDNLKIVDNFERDLTNAIDDYIKSHHLNAPREELKVMNDGYAQPLMEILDLKKEKIGTVIWSTGYAFDYRLLKLPVLDKDGFPIQSHGVTDYPGLYFVGMPWMPSERTGFLIGVGESAQHIASIIAGAPVEIRQTVI